jgi:hypothetical protein
MKTETNVSKHSPTADEPTIPAPLNTPPMAALGHPSACS